MMLYPESLKKLERWRELHARDNCKGNLLTPDEEWEHDQLEDYLLDRGYLDDSGPNTIEITTPCQCYGCVTMRHPCVKEIRR